jgi:hypothetical protein
MTVITSLLHSTVRGLTRMATANPNAQTLRRILVDLEVVGRAVFNKDERRLVLQILLELVEKVAKLEDDVRQVRPITSHMDSENLPRSPSRKMDVRGSTEG